MTVLTQNEALEKCGFALSGGKWKKQLKFDDPEGRTFTLFQINGRVGWSVDIEKEGNIKTEPAGRMKDTPVYDIIQAELTALDEMVASLEEEKKEAVKDPLDNLKDSGFEIPEELHENPIVDDSTTEKTPETPKYEYQKPSETPHGKTANGEKWSKPAQKEKKRPVNEDIQDAEFEELQPEELPVLPVVGGIVRPAVTARQALAAWREFQELKKYIIEPSDIQVIETTDKRTGQKKKQTFVKKSGWRKFATFYNLTDRIVEEKKEMLASGGFLWRIKVVCVAPNGRETEGIGMCSTTERGFAHPDHDCYSTAHTRAKNRAISDMIAAGEVSAEEIMYGGVA